MDDAISWDAHLEANFFWFVVADWITFEGGKVQELFDVLLMMYTGSKFLCQSRGLSLKRPGLATTKE